MRCLCFGEINVVVSTIKWVLVGPLSTFGALNHSLLSEPMFGHWAVVYIR